VRQLHQQHLALERLALVGREHLVEDRQRHVMLGGEDLVPVSRRGFQALHQRLAAVVGGHSDGDAGERGTEHRSRAFPP